LVLSIVYAFYKGTSLIPAVLSLVYFYGSSSLFFLISNVFQKIREVIYAVLPPVFFALVTFFSVLNFFVYEEIALKVYTSILHELLAIFNLEGSTVFVGMAILFLILFLVFTLLLFVIRYAYIKKLYNNTIFLFDVVWFFHLAFTISLADRQDFIFWLLFVFCIYKGAFIACSILLRKHFSIKDIKSLLILRVFSLNEASASLFRKFQSYWRYQGPINLIAGYDLTATTIDINDLLTFVSGRMKNRFNLSLPLINKNIQQIDNNADINGHFRVNELYCNNATWKTVVDRLVKTVDFVIMDIRSFSRSNNGCAHEIRELIHKVALERICFLIDQNTDLVFFEDCVATAWNIIPATAPNLNDGGNKFINVYQFSDEKELNKLLV
jgi:hypothetical protein